MPGPFTRILERGMRQDIYPGWVAQARQWYRGQAKRIATSPKHVMREESKLTDHLTIGDMYFYFYDPKHKATLPYYDTFPLIFPVAPTSSTGPNGKKDAFFGINFHYLNYNARARLMNALYEIRTNNRFDDSTKIFLSYQVLKSTEKFKYFRPAFKMYLNSHVRSRFFKVDSNRWDIALMLPVARFKKARTPRIWADSSRMYRKRSR